MQAPEGDAQLGYIQHDMAMKKGGLPRDDRLKEQHCAETEWWQEGTT